MRDWSPSPKTAARSGTFTSSRTAPLRVQIEHDREHRVFRIAQADGTTSVFRDEPVRYLVAVRNSETGDVSPMLRYGYPEYLLLCREET